jgi:hypothetical protein
MRRALAAGRTHPALVLLHLTRPEGECVPVFSVQLLHPGAPGDDPLQRAGPHLLWGGTAHQGGRGAG